VPQDARIHYAYLDAGGTAPNVVQAMAKVRYSVRSLSLTVMLDLVERVKQVARGAAMMTGTSVDIAIMSAVSNTLGNDVMDAAMQQALEELGGVAFDADDRTYAAAIQATLSPEDIASAYRASGVPPRQGEPLCDYVVPLGTKGEVMIGSTDVADVSWKVPTVEALVATHAIGTPGHSWQITAQGKSPAAHKGMVHAAKAMARCGELLFADPARLARAIAEHQAKLAVEPYICPIPDGVRPPLQPRPMAAE
jgi:aminobenzoyl-glutamate utilization protein B